MNVDLVYPLKNKMDEKGIVFYYAGYISQGIIEEIGEVVRSKLGIQSNTSTSEKVFGIFVEQLNNIMNHSADKKKMESGNLSSGIIIVGSHEEKFFVIGGNKITEKQKIFLDQKLTLMKSADAKELKKQYKEQLHKDFENNDKGAGLGLLDMTRKSSAPIEYSFTKIPNELFFPAP